MHGVEEIKIHVAGFFVAPAFGSELGFEAFPLVEGIIKLAIGVTELGTVDEEFEAFDEET